MSTLSTYRLTSSGSGPGVGRTRRALIHAGFVGLLGALAREHEIRRSIKELASLDDRMLRDIGLTRWDVERAVRFGRI